MSFLLRNWKHAIPILGSLAVILMKNWGRFFQSPKKAVTTTGVIAAVAFGGFALNERSLNTLAPTSPQIQAVAKCAATKPMKLKTGEKITFVVYHGLRTESEQRSMLAKGVSWVNRSRHQDGDAIDVMAMVNGKGTWEHAPYYEIAQAFFKCGTENSVAIEWGGNWKIRDMVHFQVKK